MSRRLAEMFMLLVERYGRRGNWRSYCVDDTTEALTKRGWVSYDQLTTDDIILSYDSQKLAWSKIFSIYKDRYEGDMFHLTARGLDALITPGHKMVTQDGLKRVEYLLEKDKIVLIGDPVQSGDSKYDDAFVKLVGWTVTEGSFYKSPKRNYHRVTISQNEGDGANDIRSCLAMLDARYSEYRGKATRHVRFNLTKNLCEKLKEVIDLDGKTLTNDFILSLTQSQRLLLIDTMINGDGWVTSNGKKTYKHYCQKSKKHVDAFVFLCTLAGIRTSTKIREIVSYGKSTTVHTVNLFSDRANHTLVENVDFHGGKRAGKIKGRGKINHPNEPTIPYAGIVWCPKTEFGCFIARRNGVVYLTGNTYNDEMRCNALLQLSQIGLQFDESKSDNPFAFYTTTIKNSFTRVLNLERKSQHIRDEMLIMSGALPSYNRQIDHEIEMRALAEGTAPPEPPKRKKIVPKKSSNQDL